jgi:hypothetical protein
LNSIEFDGETRALHGSAATARELDTNNNTKQRHEDFMGLQIS